MAKKTLITGIDIGASAVKVATLAWTEKGKVELKKATRVEVDLPPEPPTPEELRDLKAAALKRALSEHRVKGGRTVTAISREDAVIRYITLPSTRDEELDEMLQYDIERHVPFATDQMDIGYQVLRKREDQESEIVLAAVPEDRMREHLDILEKAGLEPDLIDVSIFGTCQAFMNGGPLGTVRGVANVGWNATEVGFFREGVVVFSRSVSFGYQRLQQAFLDRGLTPEEVPDFNRMTGPAGEAKQEWFDSLVLQLSRTLHAFRHETHNPSPEVLILCGGMASAPGLAQKLSQALGINTELVNPMLPDKVIPYRPVQSLPEPGKESAEDEGGEEEREPVSVAHEPVAVAEGSETSATSTSSASTAEAGLDEFDLDSFTPPAQPEPVKQEDRKLSRKEAKLAKKEAKEEAKKGGTKDTSTGKKGKGREARDRGATQIIGASPVASSPMPEYATAVGLAMRNAGNRTPLNLLPDRIIRQRESARSRKFARTAGLLLLLILLQGAAAVGLEFYDRISYRNELQASIQRINPVIADIKEAQDQLARIAGYQDKEHSFYRILYSVYELTPEGTQYYRMIFTKQKELRINGYTWTMDDANQLVRFLADAKGPDGKSLFSEVNAPRLRMIVPPQNKDIQICEFEIVCKIASDEEKRKRSGR